MDPARIYRRDLQDLVGPDETVRAAAMCRATPGGSNQLERSMEDFEREYSLLPTQLRKKAAAASFRTQSESPPREKWYWRVLGVLSGGDSIVRADPDKLFGGVVARGAADSCAAHLNRHLHGDDSIYCVVTDRRLLLAARTLSTDAFRPLADVPVEAVTGARRHGWFLQRGRVVLNFADGSMLTVFTGIFGTARANTLVDALTSGPDERSP
jgi:hypothetical protein